MDAINVDSQIRTLADQIEKLDDLPKKLQIYGFLSCIIRGELTQYSVYVDRWPEWTTILAKPKHQHQKNIPVYKLGIYCKDPSQLTKMLSRSNFLPEDRTIWIYGLPVDLLPSIQHTAKVLKHHLKTISLDDPRYFVELPMYDLDDVVKMREFMDYLLENDFYLSPLNSDKHLDTIISSWKTFNFYDFFISDEEGRQAIKYYLSFKNNLGVFKKSDDKLVSWGLNDIDGSGLMRNTNDPEYRSLNLSNWIILEFCVRYKMNKKPFWGFMTTEVIKTLIPGITYAHEDVACVHCILRPNKAML